MEYSDNILRGLSRRDWISDGIVGSAAFQFSFDEKHVKNEWASQSICWEDDDSVIDLMLQQEKDDHPQFRAGIARLERQSIDRICKLQALRNVLSYEREPLVDNRYHGNILLSAKSSKMQRKLLPATLALHVSGIVHRSEDIEM